MKGLLWIIYAILGDVDDLADMFPEPDFPDEETRKRAIYWRGNFITRMIDLLCGWFDLINVLIVQIGWRVVWRGLRRRLAGKEADLGLTVFSVPAYVERSEGYGIDPVAEWRRVGIASWCCGMDAQAFYYAVGSKQARWARTVMANRPAVSWGEKRAAKQEKKTKLAGLLAWLDTEI